MSRVVDEIAEQQAANAGSAAHRADFSNHRKHTTALLAARAPFGGEGRLLVLGAGNCNDLELSELGKLYREIHLVDIDEPALQRATQPLEPELKARITTHAGIDVSGLLDRLERWKAHQVTFEELVQHPQATADGVALALGGGYGGGYDVVLSSCLLTQMQLMVVNVLGESHRLFEAVRRTLTLTHLRTLSRLLTLGGSALMTIDATSDRLAPLGTIEADRDLRDLLQQRTRDGLIFHVADPNLVKTIANDDPILGHQVLSEPLDAWIWHNGPHTRFLVYALELRRLGGGGGGGGGGGSE